MAFRGFGKLKDAITDLDSFTASATLAGPIFAAERIVAELQNEGPAWTGRFANSWRIEGPQGQVAEGTGQPGLPRPVKFMNAPFTGPQALSTLARTTIFKDKVIFTISNFASGREGPYALKAMDIEEGKYEYPGVEPLKDAQEGVRLSGIRGDLGLASGGPNRRTAPLDWYSDYVRGGRLNEAVRLMMDRELGRLR
jgi:hypothetical protein